MQDCGQQESNSEELMRVLTQTSFEFETKALQPEHEPNGIARVVNNFLKGANGKYIMILVEASITVCS